MNCLLMYRAIAEVSVEVHELKFHQSKFLIDTNHEHFVHEWCNAKYKYIFTDSS